MCPIIKNIVISLLNFKKRLSLSPSFHIHPFQRNGGESLSRWISKFLSFRFELFTIRRTSDGFGRHRHASRSSKSISNTPSVVTYHFQSSPVHSKTPSIYIHPITCSYPFHIYIHARVHANSMFISSQGKND